MEASKSETKEHKQEIKAVYVSKQKKNPWVIYTVVLAVAVIILSILLYRGGGVTGNTIDKDKAAEKLVSYLNSRTGGGVELVSSEKDGSLYNVLVSYNGDEIPVYITTDGQYFVQGVVPITEEPVGNDTGEPPEPVEIVKSDKPKVELFIWGYCPYGVQAQGPLAEVASLLKGKADFESVLYYAGHGEYEAQQNKIQACIQEVAKDKYWEYAAGFVKDIYPKCGSSRDIDCDKNESIKLMKSLGISSSKVMSCVGSKGDDLVAEYASRAQSYGVTGSPTLIINGIKVNPDRSAEAFKAVVCEAFNNAPSECSAALNSNSTTASGNC